MLLYQKKCLPFTLLPFYRFVQTAWNYMVNRRQILGSRQSWLLVASRLVGRFSVGWRTLRGSVPTRGLRRGTRRAWARKIIAKSCEKRKFSAARTESFLLDPSYLAGGHCLMSPMWKCCQSQCCQLPLQSHFPSCYPSYRKPFAASHSRAGSTSTTRPFSPIVSRSWSVMTVSDEQPSLRAAPKSGAISRFRVFTPSSV